MKVRLNVNGQAVEVEARADEMLLDVLRGELDLTSVRYTCGIGVCGACTALVDGEPISMCILLASGPPVRSAPLHRTLPKEHRRCCKDSSQ